MNIGKMSPGVTFKRRPMVALAILAVLGAGLSYLSVGKGKVAVPMEITAV